MAPESPLVGVTRAASIAKVRPETLARMLAGGLAPYLGAFNASTDDCPDWRIPLAAVERWIRGELAGSPHSEQQIADLVAERIAARLHFQIVSEVHQR